MLRRRPIDLHAADGIGRERAIVACGTMLAAAATRRRRTVMMMRVTIMRVTVICLCHRELFPAEAALETYTPRGYMSAMRDEIKSSCLKRLKRIEGQIRGLAKMVEDDRYCIDVVTQIGAARAALRRVEEEVLRDHVAHCVEHAISSGDKADQRRKIAELMDVIGRADR
jgi:CsoR family transcriptional regulator, copper-sensing transcriptional repressor